MDATATEQKKQTEVTDLFDDVLDKDNPFNDTMKTESEGIFTDDSLFDDNDQKTNKKSFGRCPSGHKHRTERCAM